MKVFRKIVIILFSVVALGTMFASGFYYGKDSTVCQVCQPSEINFSLFWTAYNQLKEKFVDPTKITNDNVLYGAIAGMAQSLEDPYTTFFNPEDAQKFTDELAGYFDGIGIEISLKQGSLTVVAPLEGTPAKAAGLRPGDIILKIDGKDTTNMSSDEAVTLIRGPKGTDVTLSIYRSSWSKPKDIKITRDTIKVPSLKWELKDNNIAYLKLYQFSQSLDTDFTTVAAEILNSSAKKIILDLRGNPGGYLEVAQNIAGWFLEAGQTVVIEDFGQEKEQKVYKAEGNAKFVNYPIVILMDEGSASASEILAGAIKDNRSVSLIGTKSFGKGSVQEGVYLYDGSYIKITIAKWLTPKGTSISEKGLDPDVKVELSDSDYQNNKDPQLDKAIEIIKEIQ